MTLGPEANISPSPAGLYLHVPFCRAKCPYCDFFSLTNLDQIEAYIEALLVELNLRRQSVPFADTIYFGGGTPSLLTPKQLERIFDRVYENFSVTADAEVTLEVNPGTVNKDDLAAYRSIGINRLNIGLQSIKEETLRFLGRIHSSEQGVKTYRSAREVGFERVGLDLIYAIPGQRLSRWEEELTDVIRMEPDHLSCYTLTLEEGTPMAAWIVKGAFCPLDEKNVGDLFSFTTACLTSNQYEQYEISNFARCVAGDCIDRRSRHNCKYWNFNPYLGFGPAAHSYLPTMRWWNHRSLRAYLSDLEKEKLPVAGKETLTREQQMIEFIYLGLRQTDGIDTEAYELRFETDFYDTVGSVLMNLTDEGLVECFSKQIRLTGKGMRFHESVVGRLIG